MGVKVYNDTSWFLQDLERVEELCWYVNDHLANSKGLNNVRNENVRVWMHVK